MCIIFFNFQVSKEDTLAGIAIKYDCNIEDIKRENKLYSDMDLCHKETIFIPTVSQENIKKVEGNSEENVTKSVKAKDDFFSTIDENVQNARKNLHEITKGLPNIK